MVTTDLKSVSSMKLHRDLGITQKSAWFVLRRIRQAYKVAAPMLDGSVEIDEAFVGGKEQNRQTEQTTPVGWGPDRYYQRNSLGKPRKGRSKPPQ